MTNAELPHARDTYVRTVEDANRRWKAEAETLDGQYALRLARQDTDQSPAALHSQYLRQRETGRLTWQLAVAAAIEVFRHSTGETALPALGWTPDVPEPLTGPGHRAPARATALSKPKPQKRTRWLPLAGAIAALMLIGVVLSATNKPSPVSSTGSTSGSSAYSSTVQVLYEVEGTATGVDLTMESGTGTVQANDKAVPLANKASGKKGLTYTMPRGHFVYLSAQNQGSSGTVTCRITVDGTVVSTNTSSGGYAIASCSGTAR